MSGGIRPINDITLAREEPHEPDVSNAALKTTKTPPPTRRRSLSPLHIITLSVAIVLSASGMVSAEDAAFVLFSIIYTYFMSKVVFPPTSPRSKPPFGEKNRILGLYALFAGLIGLFLPIAYILEGIFEGDKEGMKAAAPHLFLVCSQVFMEGVAFSANLSMPVFAFVPIFNNSKRIFTIVEWLRSEFSRGSMYEGSAGRLYAGRALAVANMAFWSFNLFGFLLPVFLPKVFKIYYSNRD
ncbi:UNVERIFIED_CONTAM: hypothetical protein Scaly_0853200 [Sesamum calycinum]|uniref:DUF7733 domain-containing protein n=1 Tax=Sesamum calycinum TaxID=2727403 RepID=A0AAW2QV76_9LAMI